MIRRHRSGAQMAPGLREWSDSSSRRIPAGQRCRSMKDVQGALGVHGRGGTTRGTAADPGPVASARRAGDRHANHQLAAGLAGEPVLRTGHAGVVLLLASIVPARKSWRSGVRGPGGEQQHGDIERHG